jgi:hypothetical protein
MSLRKIVQQTTNGKLRRVWRAIGTSLGWIGLTGIVWAASLWGYQADKLPHIANGSTGRIYPRNIHGTVVYQTATERNYLERVQYGTIGILTLGIVMSLIYDKKWGNESRIKPFRMGIDNHPK